MDHEHSRLGTQVTDLPDMAEVLRRLAALEQENQRLRNQVEDLQTSQEIDDERIETLEESGDRARIRISELESKLEREQQFNKAQ